MTTLRILAAALLGGCWPVLVTAAGSDAASCVPEHAPTGRAYISYSDPDDPQSWRDHEAKVPGGLRALCVETSTTGSVPSDGDGDGGGTSTWALVGGAGVVAAGSTVLALRRRPG
jgi:hypothetical protein